MPVSASLSRMLGAAGLFAILAAAPVAADPTLSVQPEVSKPAAGQSFSVDIVVDAVTNAYAFQFDVTFDPSLLRLTSVTNGAVLPGANFSGGIDGDGSVRFVYNLLTGPVPGVTGGGSLARLTFETFPDRFGTSAIQVGNVILLDAAGADIAVAGVAFGSAEYDGVPPVFGTVTASPSVLWPPNHKMVPVTITAPVTDGVDPGPVTRIVAVSSNEPANGAGDGSTAEDWQVTGPLTLNLRAERSGKGSGRTYTVTVESRDASGNASRAEATVTVPHD